MSYKCRVQSADINDEVAVIDSMPRVGTPKGNCCMGILYLTNRDGQSSSQTGSQVGVCLRCGRSHQLKQCPAFGQQCKKCRRRNHFARVCRFTGTQTYLVEESLKDEEDNASENQNHSVLQIVVEKMGKKHLAQFPVVVNGREQHRT